MAVFFQNFKYLFVCLFIWLHLVLVVECRVFTCSTGILSCSMEDCFSWGVWTTLSCSMWDLVPWPGTEPGAPALEVWSLSHWTTREVPPHGILNERGHQVLLLTLPTLREQGSPGWGFCEAGTHARTHTHTHSRSLSWNNAVVYGRVPRRCGVPSPHSTSVHLSLCWNTDEWTPGGKPWFPTSREPSGHNCSTPTSHDLPVIRFSGETSAWKSI